MRADSREESQTDFLRLIVEVVTAHPIGFARAATEEKRR